MPTQRLLPGILRAFRGGKTGLCREGPQGSILPNRAWRLCALAAWKHHGGESLSQVQAGRHRRVLGPVSLAPGHSLTTPIRVSSGLVLLQLSAASAEQQGPQDAAPWAPAALACQPPGSTHAQVPL